MNYDTFGDTFGELLMEAGKLGLTFSNKKESNIQDFSEPQKGIQNEMVFQRPADGTVPTLEIHVQRFELGCHVIVNSTPYDQKYHRNTGVPIEGDQVIDQLRTYLTEVTGQQTE